MEKQKRVFRAIKSEVDRIDLNVTIDTLFFHDSETGEAIPVLEVLGEDAQIALRQIQKTSRKETRYSMLYQDTIVDLAKILTPGEIRVLMSLLGDMKYENKVYGVTLRSMAAKIGALFIMNVKEALWAGKSNSVGLFRVRINFRQSFRAALNL